jgi:DNA repair protein RadC
MVEYKTNISKISLIKEKTDFKKCKISSSLDGANYAHQFYHGDIEIYESFFVILMNNANNTVGYVKISQGGVTSTVVDVAIVAKYAVESLSRAVILVHNHPSGKLEPSPSDNHLTKKVKDTLAIFDCKVLDHLILVPKEPGQMMRYYSYADEGKL